MKLAIEEIKAKRRAQNAAQQIKRPEISEELEKEHRIRDFVLTTYHDLMWEMVVRKDDEYMDALSYYTGKPIKELRKIMWQTCDAAELANRLTGRPYKPCELFEDPENAASLAEILKELEEEDQKEERAKKENKEKI